MRVLGALLVLLALVVVPATARAAEPAAATVSADQPATSWHGSVTGGYATYAALVGADLGGAAGSAPCVAPSCDTFKLTVEGTRSLQIVVRSPETDIVTVRVTGPSGRTRYDSGFADPAETVVQIARATPGVYTIDVTTNALDAATYTATASTDTVGEPGPGPRDYDEYVYEKVRVPMRDGVEISAEIWRPKTETKVPVILHFTPYHVLSPAHGADRLPMVDGPELVYRGYAFVFADVRGTWSSGGCWDYGGAKEVRDGHDLVEFLGEQDWSNGRVGMMGVSYPGTTPNAAAVARPKHLKTIVPISAISRWYGYAYQQGVRATTSGEDADIDPPGVTPSVDFMFAYGFLPPPDPAALTRPDQTAMRWRECGRGNKTLKAYSTQPDYGSFWKARDYLRRANRVKVPVLVSHGQLDFNVKTWEGTAWWEAVKGPKALVLGQWAHAYPGTYWDGWQGLMERWFERWLYGIENGVEDEPRVHVQTNDGTWHVQNQWGAKATTERAFPLTGAGDFGFTDDGLLTESEVLRGVGEDVRWARVPVPGTEGPLRFGGRPVLRLRATSDQPGTHATAVLCDVGPDGACNVISRAFMNARYRDGLETGADLPAGQKVTLPLEFIDKDYVVAAGHHLELRVASSSATWVLSDEHHANNVFHLGESDLLLPVYE